MGADGLKVGFIGCGKIGSAIIRGMVRSGLVPASCIAASDTAMEKPQELEKELGTRSFSDNAAIARFADIIFLAVKPSSLGPALAGAGSHLAGKAVVSIAAGWTMEHLRSFLPPDARLLRAMPNTPLMVGEGMTALANDGNLKDEEFAFVKSIFSALGKVETLPECLMDAATGVSGSGPAYFYMFIGSLAGAGEDAGLPKETALLMAAQTAMGAAKMVLDTGKDPGSLRDEVCSPGGTTIEAVASFEKDGLDKIVKRAVKKCIVKSQRLSKQ
ncbi:MAG: pyrroline-5-carboxylate reductase [Bacillota bacterium]|nr:pyrroline-5-carboxylate reductase [Bacillota bacterium]